MGLGLRLALGWDLRLRRCPHHSNRELVWGGPWG